MLPNIFQGIRNTEERIQSDMPYSLPPKRHFRVLGLATGYHFLRESNDTELYPITNWLPQDVEEPDLKISCNLNYYLKNDCVVTKTEGWFGY